MHRMSREMIKLLVPVAQVALRCVPERGKSGRGSYGTVQEVTSNLTPVSALSLHTRYRDAHVIVSKEEKIAHVY